MLKPEQAKAQLAQWELPKDTFRLVAAVKTLPESIRKSAATLFGIHEDREAERRMEYHVRQQRAIAAAWQLDQASVAERRAVFELLAPHLASAIEATWQLLKTTPYQTGYNRKAFRAPQHPQLLTEKIGNWLTRISQVLGRFQPEALTAPWLAAWAPHLQQGYAAFNTEIGMLLAGVLNRDDAESDAVFEILRQSLSNEHEIGCMGRHVYTAMLLSHRRQGWELIEKTLLAAQRQEGLRQGILEAIDETHPEAFRRMLRLILDNDLMRFASVVRAVDVWFGQLWAAASDGVIKKMLTQVVQLLEEPAARAKAIKGKEPEAAFLALWCAGVEDAVASVEMAAKLLSSKTVEMRYIAVRHLTNLDLDVASVVLLPALGDDDLRVAIWALLQGHYQSETDPRYGLVDDRFERVEKLLERVPGKSVTLKAIVWPWTEMEVKQSQIANFLVQSRGNRPAARLIPHLSKLESYRRKLAVEQIAAAKPWDVATRQVLFDLVGDATEVTRGAAMQSLSDVTLTVVEAEQLENYLTRKSSDLRRGVLDILFRQTDEAALANGDRLMAAKDANQRLAGLELLRLLSDASRSVETVRQQAAAYSTSRKKLSKEEQSHLAEIVKEKEAVVTLDDALGLMNPADRTSVTAPRNLGAKFITPAAWACIKSLDDLIHTHSQEPVTIKTYAGPKDELFGNLHWEFSQPDKDKPIEQQQKDLPLATVWQQWFDQRGPELRDDDGLELLRASLALDIGYGYGFASEMEWAKKSEDRQRVMQAIFGSAAWPTINYKDLTERVIQWLLFLSPPAAEAYLLDATETLFAMVPPADLAQLTIPFSDDEIRSPYHYESKISDWRDAGVFSGWKNLIRWNKGRTEILAAPEQQARLWRLMHWFDEPVPGARRKRVDDSLLLIAYNLKAANLADVADHLLRPREQARYRSDRFTMFNTLTYKSHKNYRSPWLLAHPDVLDLINRAVERILELELHRGDVPSPATAPAHSIGSLWGAETLRRVLQALGKAEFKLVQRYGHTAQDRRETLTNLAKVCYLGEGETPEDFVRTMKAAIKDDQFPEERLLQLTFLAPQWTLCVEKYFGWEQMREGVYWFLAHMRYIWGVGENAAVGSEQETEQTTEGSGEADCEAKVQKLSAWERLILERTPLTDADRNEGAIDVAWFRRTHEQLGDKHWQALAAAARFAANPSQAKRAQFIADVLLNRVPRKQLIESIKKKQLKESVRLLGLLPLAKGAKRDADLIERCKVLREYRRYANGLSGLTKPAAMLSWDIGMKNLAQTAGYADPLRLEWAVGAEAVKDLADGPKKIVKGEVTVALTLDELSQPTISVQKAGKELKSIPPIVKKDKKVAELIARATDIKRQSSGIRQSLEQAMCRGDAFSVEELKTWCGHALLKPLLSRLIVCGEGIAGYPDKGGQALRDHRGKLEPVKPQESLRLAHPHDLLQLGDWDAWQKECFQAERVQPFKQIFRELYVLTKQEKKDATISHRYDGQQLQNRQALALFGSRGWNTNEGVFKIFHDLGLTANVNFDLGITTPAEVEGAALAGLYFTNRETPKPLELKTIPPRLLSEVMRDLDLVVSVAHAGGVDPEASASTVEMRAGLLRETCALLKLDNVRLKPSHAVIEGELANYSVHLGSGTVHKMPGNAICLVPVHAQQRGRLFLPFADDDPRTAEVISKVLLLARDQQIQDPTLLEQIRA